MEHSRSRLHSTLYHLLISIFVFLLIYPILWMIGTSFDANANATVAASSFSFIPKLFTLDNYIQGWKGVGNSSFSVFFKNSFIVSGLTVIGQVASSTIAAYGFSRIRFKGSRMWFFCMMVTLMLPQQIIIIPQYIIFSKLGMINSYLPLVLPAFFGYPFFIFLIMQFIQGIPADLDEAAKIDGCNKISIFYRIILPLIKPAIATSVIFSFYWSWQDFFGPLLFIQSPEKYTLSLALSLFVDPSSVTNWGSVFAMSFLSLLPIFLLFVFTQKYLVEGISMTGLKS